MPTEKTESPKQKKLAELDRTRLLQECAKWFSAAIDGTLTEVLIQSLVRMLDIQEFSLLEFRINAAPAILSHYSSNEADLDPELETYLARTYLVDPYYNLFLRGDHWGFASFEEIMPDWMEHRHSYTEYQKLVHMVDECGYLISVADGVAIHLALIRSVGERQFGMQATSLLKDLEPIFSAVFKLYWTTHHDPDDPGLAMRQEGFSRISSVLSFFGSTVLTPREQEMVQLLLKGYSAKLVSEAMNISVGTANVHRANIYKKLDINSYKELFSVFIDAISSVEICAGEDIYQAYTSPPKSPA